MNSKNSIAGYEVVESLYSGHNSAVYRVRAKSGSTLAVIKLLNQAYPSPDQLARFRHEFAIAETLAKAVDGVIGVTALETHENSLAILMEDVGGRDLRESHFTPKQFLPIAIRMVEALDGIHKHHVIHKDINPGNFVWNEETGDVRLIDFGLSSELAVERQQAGGLDVLQGSLAYISPEQSGRMNRAMDYRTDFYSLGVTFYQMLTGKLPFDSTDPLELVHCHLARTPTKPSDVEPIIPPTLCSIIRKLMEKGAEERYQSAAGLRADLIRVKDLLDSGNEDAHFQLGRDDVSDQFHIPQKLYGRESETETLLATFDRASRGRAELLLVAGYSGVGKTMLIEEVHKPLAGRKGFFISGKFDQYKRDIPYAPIVGAFQNLIRQLLTERDDQIAAWRSKLLGALGDYGQIIIDTIPEVEAIIGEQPAVLDVGGMEAEKRFNETFAKFVSVFCGADHPVLLFLDDLQWTDPASLKLIQLLLTNAETKHLLVIGAYRDNEVSPSHPLMLAINEIEKDRPIETILLAPLAATDARQLVVDTVACDHDAVEELTTLIMRKTNGNPFFINRLLLAIHDQGLLWFDADRNGWDWDPARIAGMDASDNVVDLMVAELRQLPDATQELLRLASCLGNQFEPALVARITGKPLREVVTDLTQAVKDDLIAPLDAALRYAQWATGDVATTETAAARYRFCHDRIQEAAYSQLSDDKRLETHYSIGMSMLEGFSAQEFEDRLFDIVQQLNNATAKLSSDAERARVARLNLDAAVRARASTANAAALNYLEHGASLLGEAGWKTDHATMFELFINRTECEFLCGRLDESEAAFNTTIANAVENFEKLRTYELMMRIHLTSNKFDEGLRLAREALAIYDIDLPFDDPDAMQALADRELADVDARLSGMELGPLLDAPEHGDESLAYCIAILVRVWTLGFLRGNLPTMNFAGLKNVALTLERGNDKYSSFGFIVFGMIEAAGKENFARAYELGMLAMDMNRRFQNIAAIPPINNLFGHIISHYNMHYRHIAPIFQESYERSLQSGEIEWGVWASNFVFLCPFIEGRPLDTVNEEIERFSDFVEGAGSESILNMMRFHRNLVLNLQGLTDGPDSLDTEDYTERQVVAYLETGQFEYGWLWYYLYRSVLCYLQGDYARALELSNKAEEKKVFAPAFMKFAEQHFYHPLILAAAYPDMSEEKKADAISTIENYRDRLANWAQSCPENYRHKHLLVAAELARLTGRDVEARRLYDDSIEAAREDGYLQNEALGNELAGRYRVARNREKAAMGYLTEAQFLYERWGALRKAAAMNNQYRFLARRNERRRDATVDVTQTDSTSLDLVTVIEASQALSAEVNLGRVLERLMRIMQENAGAENARLVLRNQGEWRMQADLSGGDVSVLQSRTVSPNAGSDPLFPLTLLRFVIRSADRSDDSAQPLVFDDLSSDPAYRNDPYVIEQQPRSVLCLPVRFRNRLVGVLYLENNLATAVFDPARVKLLTTISSQIAISIDNARLYDDLENQVAERTAELRLAKEAAEHAQARVANLLDHSGQGFLSFGADLIVDPEYSRACLQMLGEAPADKNAADALFEGDAHKMKLLRMGADMVFQQNPDAYQLDMILSLFPKEMQRRDRTVQISYTLLDNGHVMAVLTDVTEERRLQARVRKEHLILRMVVAAVTENRDFFEAVQDFRDYLATGLAAQFETAADARDLLAQIFREVHTFKGTLNQFSFLHTPEALHALEEKLGALLRSEGGITVAQVAAVVEEADLIGLFERDMTSLRQILGGDFLEGGARVTLSADQAVRLEQLASKLLQGETVDTAATEMRRFLTQIGYLRKVPLKDLLLANERVVKQVAARLEKEIAPMEVTGGADIWIDPDRYSPFGRSLAHLFRNAVSHGIEHPDERLMVDKEEVGHIRVSIDRVDEMITMRIADDGAGVNADAVRARLVEVGLLDKEAAAALPEVEVIDKIFADSMTTKREADHFSGRGVGLAAVRALLRELGGDVKVETELGVGTTFVITLPVAPDAMVIGT